MSFNPNVTPTKITYEGDTLLDLTGDTVTAETLAEGVTAHTAAGVQVTGTMATTTEWGDITGTLSDQTDLNNELTNIREVAQGKTKSYVVSDVTNPSFNTQASSFTISGTFTDINGVSHNASDLKLGDNIYVIETDVPDRWCSAPQSGTVTLYKLETAKVPVTDVQVNGSSVVSNTIANIDLSGKQDTLTAGQNITITNNVISASTGGSVSLDYLAAGSRPSGAANASATSTGAVAIGYGSKATGSGSFGIGKNANAAAGDTTAIGNSAAATKDNATALGWNSNATGENAIAIGGGSRGYNDNSTAIGYAAKANNDNSVALGASSTTSATYEVSVGKTGTGAFQRKITNVADGSVASGSKDAVNGGQLYTLLAALEARITALGG